VGWKKGGVVCLLPAESLKVARTDGGADLAISERKLGESLHQQGLLDRTEFSGGKLRYKVRFRVGSSRRYVWAVPGAALEK
jgi:hypothetical protein